MMRVRWVRDLKDACMSGRELEGRAWDEMPR